MITDLWWKYKF